MTGYGIELKPLSEETLELVRNWRNDNQTAQFMEFRNHISEADQLRWFSALQNAHYFVIYSDNIPVGLIDLKKIDEQRKTAESGLLIGNKEFLGTGIALGASILLLDFAFHALNLETVTAKINKHNSEAIKYNQLLGFEKQKNLSNDFEEWQIDEKQFLAKRTMLEKMI